MLTTLRLPIVFAFVFAVVPRPANSQQLTDCNSALIQDVDSKRDDSALRLNFLRTMSKETFDRTKEGGSAGATIPIKGVPLNVYANYDKFQQAVKQESENVGIYRDEAHSRAYVKTELSSNSASAYAACLEKVRAVGIYVWVKYKTDTSATVVFHWIPPNGPPRKEPITLQLKGTENPVPNVKPIFEGEENLTYSFTRSPEQDFEVIVQRLGGYSDSVLLPAKSLPTKSIVITDTRTASELTEAAEKIMETKYVDTADYRAAAKLLELATEKDKALSKAWLLLGVCRESIACPGTNGDANCKAGNVSDRDQLKLAEAAYNRACTLAKAPEAGKDPNCNRFNNVQQILLH